MLKQNLGNTYHLLADTDLKTLAAKTEGYSYYIQLLYVKYSNLNPILIFLLYTNSLQ